MKVKNAKIISYADDTAIVFAGSSWEEVKNHSEQGLIRVIKWLNDNLLTLNTDKTNYMCFSIYSNSQPINDPEIGVHTFCNSSLNGNCSCPRIGKVECTKYLGVMLDQNLSWYPHIEHLMVRLRKLTWIFKTLRYIVPAQNADRSNKTCLLNRIYYALAQSILNYCILVWGGASKVRFLELERAQRALIKTMYFKKIDFSTEKIFQISKLLSVRKLYIRSIIIKKHSSLLFNPNSKQIRKRHNIIKLKLTKTKFAGAQFTFRAINLYNKINEKINIYKKNLYEVKRDITNWLEQLTYNDIENLIL